MKKRFVKTLFSGVVAATVLFQTLGNSSIVSFAENEETDQNVEETQDENGPEESSGESDSAGDLGAEAQTPENTDNGDNPDNSNTGGDGDSSGAGNEQEQNNTDNPAAGSATEGTDSQGSKTDAAGAEGSVTDAAGAEGSGVNAASTESSVTDEANAEDSVTEDAEGIKITYIANNGGKIAGEENVSMITETVDLEAETVTVVGAVATPDEGYEFVNWTYDEQVISEYEAYIPTAEYLKALPKETSQVTFYANFTLSEDKEDGLTYEEPFKDEVTVGGITVSAYAEAGVIPDGSKLNVTRVDSSVEEKVKEAAKELTEETDANTDSDNKNSDTISIKAEGESSDGTTLDGTYTFDITITNEKVDGQIQPKDDKAVTITFSNVIDSADEDTYLSVYYVKTNEVEEATETKSSDEKASNKEASNEEASNEETESADATDASSKEAEETNESKETNNSDSSSSDTSNSETTVENLEKVKDPSNNTTDIAFDAYHFSKYTIVSTRETKDTYKPAEYTPKAYKLLTGRELEAGEFTFSIVRTDKDGNPYDESSELYFKESGVANDANGLITFSTLSFDTPDQYYFKITEDIPADADKDPHMTYDESYYILRIYVSEYIDDRDKLVANPAYVKNDTLPPVIVSLYDYYGPTINVDHVFKFSDGSTYYEGTTKKTAAVNTFNRYTGTNAADKRFTGIVQSTLGDDGYPVLNSSVTGSSESLSYLFTDATPGVADKRENVILYDIGDADSYVYVNKAFFPFDDNGKKESGDSHNYHFSVVTDAAFVIPEDGLVHSETNHNITSDMVYEFEGDDDVWVFVDGKLVLDLGGVHDKVGATINFNSGVIQYYQFANKNSGSKVNTVTSNLSEVYGSTWKDGKVHTLKIFYFERGKSLSEFDSNFNLAMIAEFNNVYDEEKVINPATVNFSGTKTLEGRDLEEGEFSFELKDEEGTVIETVKNNADGTFSFSDIEYVYNDERDDIGDHKYTISEVTGNLKDVTYDTTVYEVTVHVTYDSLSSSLVATIEGLNSDGSGADFTNKCVNAETSVKFSGTKTLTGRSLAAGEFSFVLKDSDGNTLETVTNNADGTFAFSTITYVINADKDETGDHKYTISEVIGSLANVTYDTTVFNVTVTVTYDEATNKLTATIKGISSDGSGANFFNTYTTPPTPPSPPTVPPTPPTTTPPTTTVTLTTAATPAVLGATREVVTPAETPEVLGESRVKETGDDSRILLRVFIIIVCAGVLAGIIIMENKKNKTKH